MTNPTTWVLRQVKNQRSLGIPKSVTTVTNGQKCAWLNFLWHPKVKWVLDTSLESLLSVVFGTSGITFQNRSGKFLFDIEARYPEYGK